MRFSISIIALIIITFTSVYGQKNFTLNIIFNDTSNNELSSYKKEFDGTKTFYDTLQIHQQLELLILRLRGSGYLAVSVDSIKRENLKTIAFIYTGEKYMWASLKQGNIPVELLEGTGFRKKLYSKKPFRFDQIALINSKILRNCENRGYPFAVVALDSIVINEKLFSASLSVNKNRFLHVDSIIIKGSADVTPVYIYNYIGIAPGDVYKESQIRRISNRFRELPFIRELKTSQVLFTEKETKLFLFLENRKSQSVGRSNRLTS